MGPHSRNLFEILKEGGPAQLFIVALMIFCTGWLIVRRVIGCFRAGNIEATRDIAQLLAAPIMAILVSIIRVAKGVLAFFTHGLDSDLALFLNLEEASTVCSIALLCFIASSIALMLPQKQC